MFGLIRQLAVSNLLKNRSLYYPFVLATSLTIAIFYIFMSLTFNPGLQEVYGGAQVIMILGLGSFIVAVASLAIILYANSFVMKNRTKELGLYEILGLNKGHLVQMVGLELLLFGVMSTGLGLGLGLLLDQLIYAILLKMMDWPVVLASTFQWSSVLATMILFAGIFFVTFLLNGVKLIRLKALELNKESKKGEKKGRFLGLQTFLGLGLLGAGYYMANTVKDPVAAISMFFIAVLLVMAATYLLFNAGITVFLRFLKKRENYYYQPKNFISTSNLIFRMKKNAAGLATIAILSTMVLVTMAGGSSIYIGTNSFVEKSNPHDIALLKLAKEPQDTTALSDLSRLLDDFKEQEQMPTTKQVAYSYVMGSIAKMEGNTLIPYNAETRGLPEGAIFMVGTGDYQAMTGERVELKEGEAMLRVEGHQIDKNQPFVLDGQAFQIIEEDVQNFIKGNVSDNLAGIFSKNVYMVVADAEEVLKTLPSYDLTSDQLTGLTQYYYAGLDTDLSLERQLALEEPLNAFIKERFPEQIEVYSSFRARNQKEITTLFGSLFFIGMLLTVIFMLGTVLVIYYKQVSEGYEDRENFVILQKVGLDEDQARQTIRKQVLVVFLLPLTCAFVHLTAAFQMLDKILHLFVPMSTLQIMQVTLGVCTIFLVVYLAVFAITSRSYRKIVSQ
ncbi:FtsX-like permease family protein [Streptococcus ovuberis]|uniref:FtsX-like permease family protein n=1 Tax=Streptococcus ovuberis TaxID=1936207 RepID=A0A7X6MYT4_9STRE|nr:FtsX-like permease family protein [Streptococcus ovuberis]NKZ20258.1 FtsX-like permease family protein [Streptococcus ovuberis]